MNPSPVPSSLSTTHVAVAILVALLAAIAKFAFDGLAARKANRLERIDRQLQLLYGPLLALTHASSEAWTAFRTLHRPRKGPFWGLPDDPPTDAEGQAWRIWIETVFMPLNEKIEALIVEHADLLEEDFIPPVLLELCAHIEAYRGVIAQWKLHDLSRQWSVINYPKGVRGYAQQHYEKLKRQQAALIRRGA